MKDGSSVEPIFRFVSFHVRLANATELVFTLYSA